MNIIFFTVNILILCSMVCSFVPNDFVMSVYRAIGKISSIKDEVSDTITHDKIIEYGLAQSLADYFKSQQNGSKRIDESKYGNEYKDIKNIYYDYYGLWICDLDVYTHIESELKPNIIKIDFESTTKKNPYYHFDSERFKEANNLIINVTKGIYAALDSRDYKTAMSLIGQILHTIQDFYSHSNWVENGNTDINKLIGTTDFDKLNIINTNTSNPCVSNCTKVSVECGFVFSIINSLLKNVIGISLTKCPIEYYKCYGNIRTRELVSGYSTNQKLSNGDPVEKPKDLNKCSHGGISDFSVNVASTGGINKDSGYFLLSPHAYLHLTAAHLAIQHTRFFFNEIRKNIGDTQFAEFLSLELPSSAFKNRRNKEKHEC